MNNVNPVFVKRLLDLEQEFKKSAIFMAAERMRAVALDAKVHDYLTVSDRIKEATGLLFLPEMAVIRQDLRRANDRDGMIKLVEEINASVNFAKDLYWDENDRIRK